MFFDEYENVEKCLICGSDQIEIVDATADISRCRNCSLAFVSPRPSQAAIALSYDTGANYDEWIADDRNRRALWERRFSFIAGIVNKGLLLDVGAGIGTFLDITRSNGFGICGTEISATAVSRAHELYSIEVLLGSLEQQHLPNSTFDIITLWHVLEHVPYPLITLAECHRLLRPGGYLVVAVPNDNSMMNRLKTLMGISCYRPLAPAGEIHLTHFSHITLKRAFINSGLTPCRFSSDDYKPAHTFLSRAYLAGCSFIKALTGKNYYDTILAVSRKDHDSSSVETPRS